MGKIKIHEIAKEIGLTSKEIIEKANELGIEVKSHMSGVDETEANKIKSAFSKNDKKAESNGINIVVPLCMGKCDVVKVSMEELLNIYKEGLE